jgi:uncharacterized protein (UPF0276 family)
MGAGIRGTGLGLRRAFIERVAAAPPPDIDFYEIHPENYIERGGAVMRAFERIAAGRPILAHGLTLSLGGTDPLDFDYLKKLRAFLRRFDIPWLSDHLAFTSHRGRQFHELLPLPFTLATARHVAERARVVQDFLEVPLALENVSYYLSPAVPQMSETAFLHEILARSGTSLLLDINNVYVNAHNHGSDAHEFLQTVAGEPILWIHIAGHHRRSPQLIIDTHGAAVPEPVWDLLRFFAGLRSLPPVLVERDNNIPADLSELVAEVKKAKTIARDPTRPFPAAPEMLRCTQNDTVSAQIKPLEIVQDEVMRLITTTEIPPSPHLHAQSAERLGIYRQLIHNNLRGVIQSALPLFCHFLGDAPLQERVAAFLAAGAARSRFYRHVPGEFTTYLAQVEATHPLPLPFLADLARYEATVFDLIAAPDLPGPPPHNSDLHLTQARPCFPADLRLMSVDFPVQVMTPDTAPGDVMRQPTYLALWRDPRGATVRTLQLSADECALFKVFFQHPEMTIESGFAGSHLDPMATLKRWFEKGLLVALR